jgi:hypothetical protein
MAGNRLAQRRQSERVRVLRDATAQGVRGSCDHRFRRREIRFADTHVDDVAARALERLRFFRQFHHVERLDGVDAGGVPNSAVQRFFSEVHGKLN